MNQLPIPPQFGGTISQLLSAHFKEIRHEHMQKKFVEFTNRQVKNLKKRLRRAKTKVERERVRQKMREYRASLVAQKLSED